MAVPKKKLSKRKKAKRQYEWIKLAYKIARKSISLSFRSLNIVMGYNLNQLFIQVLKYLKSLCELNLDMCF
jgi:hypothetical protein